MTGNIKINDFIDHLKTNKLVLVSRDEIKETIINGIEEERKLYNNQQRCLNERLTVSPYEVSEYSLVGKISIRGVKKWIQNGYIEAAEHKLDEKGRRRIYVDAIKRIREEKGII